jgi:hypothetical protein
MIVTSGRDRRRTRHSRRSRWPVDVAQTQTGDRPSANEGRLTDVNGAVNAVVDYLPAEALTAADVIDARPLDGDEVGALAGVPVTLTRPLPGRRLGLCPSTAPSDIVEPPLRRRERDLGQSWSAAHLALVLE